jgi:hypothetical protein
VKTKTKIIRAFLEQNKAMTIKEISKTIKADYRITHTATHRLLENQVISSTKIGPATLCKLNQKYYGLEIVQAEEERKKDLFKDKNIRQLHKDIITKLDTTLYILIYHSKNIAGINLLFISNEPYFKKKVEKVINIIPLQIQATILMEGEFKESKYINQNLIVLHNLESYYLLKCNP